MTIKKTTVVNLHREPYDVYIGRAGHGQDGYFGNPIHAWSRKEKLKSYKEYFRSRIKSDPEFKRRVLALKGKVLGCFCKPLDCHGDIIVRYIETGKI